MVPATQRIYAPIGLGGLRPRFRSNHDRALERAMEDLEPYAQRRAAGT